MTTSHATQVSTLIIGATSSLAVALARQLAASGRRLILAGRDRDALATLAADLLVRSGREHPYFVCDVLADPFAPERVVREARALGDVLEVVLALGEMDTPKNLDTLERLTRVNFTAPAALAQAFAQELTRSGGGMVVFIGSVAGDRGRAKNMAYGAAKAALATFASGLRQGLRLAGVHVLLVKPGFIDTPMTWGMKSKLIAPRELVARQITQAMNAEKNMIYTPKKWWMIMGIIQHIPEWMFKRLSF